MEAIYETIKIDSVEDIEGDALKIKGYANRYSIDGATVIDDYRTSFKPTSFKLDTFKKNPVLLYNHDTSLPVGRVTLVEVRSDGLYVEAIVYKNSDRTTYYNVRNKVVTSFSISAYPLEDYWSDFLEAYIVVKSELIEISLVPLPSNTASTIEEVSLCSLGVCSVVRSKKKATTNKEVSIVDKAIISRMVKKIRSE